MLFYKYEFKPVLEGVWLTGYLLSYLKMKSKTTKEVRISLDIGLTFLHAKLKDEMLYIKKENIILKIPCMRFKKRDIFYISSKGDLTKLAFFSNNKYYKLVATGAYTSPTLEISGIHMHNIKGTTPIKDAQRKVYLAKITRGDIVLDVCTGLGYTAITSMRRGARKVVTIDNDINVLKMAEYNPWSRGLLSSKIDVLLGNAEDLVLNFQNNFFDKIIHDPPRFSLSGQLYSLDFYKELYRILKTNGILFHYTGYPRKKSGLKLQKGIINRLKSAGFKILRVEKDYAIIAKKGN
ncbi:MAG TPA: methyltransferase domain-containing protein [Thermoprotei archaeon]|nr:methyltransferase domain-containing protein [Thermoprotei archaeon]